MKFKYLTLFLLHLYVITSKNIYGIHPRFTKLNICESREYSVKKANGTFLHITDIHIDPDYMNGSDPDELCHRKNSDGAKNIAGIYGALGSRCDSPDILVEESFEYINNRFHNVDFIIYTGDSSRHNRDKKAPRTKEQVLTDHNLVFDYFNKNFNLSRTILIPTIGNNDVIEHNALTANDKIFKTLFDLWKPNKLLSFYNSEKEKDTFLKGGYWAQDFGFSTKLKLLNINSMYLYVANKEVADCSDPSSPATIMLHWLEEKLTWIKENDLKAYVMGHIPPHDELNRRILKKECYNKLINLVGQYSGNIVSLFWGHTNTDVISFITSNKKHNKYEFITLTGDDRPEYTWKDKNIVNIMTTGPSITPYNHPALRYYIYTPFDGELLGYTQYYANLTEANEKGKKGLKFIEEYNTWYDYHLNSLSLKNFRKFIHELMISDSLWNLYKVHQSVGSYEYLKYPPPKFDIKN
ncbi:hypothetical protein K502DRAFT_366388 [Neoconidiobolus thromboides FSU 785]|nr:hypothetical protein K502DRAFT_366388 [Neoconidiobolus thromboides FSU 785]